MKKWLALMIVFTLPGGCFNADLEFEDQYRAVVEAYIYPNQEVDDICLSTMISFGDDSTGGEMITDALVSLGLNGTSRALEPDTSRPGYYLMEEQPGFQAGDSVTLTAEFGDNLLTASTVIPQAPPPVEMSARAMFIPYVQSMEDFREVEMPDPVELTWDNPDAKYYFLQIQNIESNSLSIRPDPPEGMPGGGGGFAFRMVTRPTNESQYSVSPMELEYYGTHRIIFYSVNDEYVALYQSLNQDPRELNEPYSNIEGGLGIFTAFNSDTLYLEVIPVY